MQQVIRLSVIVLITSIFVLRTYGTGPRIRGSSSYTYDPRNPGSGYRLSCEHESSDPPKWTRNGEPVEKGLVQNNGHLQLNQNTIGTEDPQSFEGLYRCQSGEETSEPVAFFVVPRRSTVNTTVQRPLEGKDVTIDCSLRFGSLRRNWTVTWTVEDKNEIPLPTSGYHIETEPSFQLVINNATIDYEGAKFQCRADRPSNTEDSQRITLNLFHNAEVTTLPEDPVVVPIGDRNGVATFEIKAYPPPSFEFCYNGTCSNDLARGRVQVSITDNDDETTYTVKFIIHNMNEYDNGNVTLRIIQAERGVDINRTVMLFLPYKIDVTMDGDIVSNSNVPLRIHLRTAIHFDYQIEFVDITGVVLSMMEGEKGKETFQYTVSVSKDTQLMARFKIGDVTGPHSDTVTIDVTEAPESNGDDNTVTIIAVISTAVVLLTLILSVTLIIIIVVWKTRKCRKSEVTDGGNVENGMGVIQMQPQPPAQNVPHHVTMNPINQPQIAVIAATPHDINGNLVHNVYPPGLYLQNLAHYGSASSDHSSAPSRKSSGGTGYESGLGSGMYPCGYSSCASNHMHYSRCAYNCESDACHVGFQQQQLQEEPRQPVQHDHSGSATASQQLTTSSNNNLTAARPPMRRNSSDPNISRHKPSPCRPLDEQTSNKLLSSSSVV